MPWLSLLLSFTNYRERRKGLNEDKNVSNYDTEIFSTKEFVRVKVQVWLTGFLWFLCPTSNGFFVTLNFCEENPLPL